MGRSNLDDAVPTYLIASKRQKNGSVEEAKSCKVVCTELIHSAKREKGVCVCGGKSADVGKGSQVTPSSKKWVVEEWQARQRRHTAGSVAVAG
jgi:hypothetical protein